MDFTNMFYTPKLSEMHYGISYQIESISRKFEVALLCSNPILSGLAAQKPARYRSPLNSRASVLSSSISLYQTRSYWKFSSTFGNDFMSIEAINILENFQFLTLKRVSRLVRALYQRNSAGVIKQGKSIYFIGIEIPTLA